MLYYDRIGIPQGIGVNKTSESKESAVCLYWWFLDQGFKFQRGVGNRCHDVLMMSMSFSNIAILNIHGAD